MVESEAFTSTGPTFEETLLRRLVTATNRYQGTLV